MGRKFLCMLLALCLMLSAAAGALAYDTTKPPCQAEGHEKGDGIDHNRPQSCWITGHFNCDGKDHTRAACGTWKHFNCDGRDHSAAPCGAEGHYLCDRKVHEAAPCGIAGHCVSDGLRHVPAACGMPGHYACDSLKHKAAPCGTKGHMSCDGLDHTPAACGAKGHYACDGLEHAPAACGKKGHCIADGRNHGAGECGIAGHIGCVGDHGPAVCGVEGHYACESGHTAKVNPYCMAQPQHKLCEKDALHYCDPAQGGCGETYRCADSNKHTRCEMCGLLWCDDSLGGHYTPCGNRNHRPCVYAMQGKTWRWSDHPKCDLCGGGKCTGRHGPGACVPVCSQCGEPLLNGKTHRASCGEHYLCITKDRDHSRCSKCGELKCRGENKPHVCPTK